MNQIKEYESNKSDEFTNKIYYFQGKATQSWWVVAHFRPRLLPSTGASVAAV